MYHLNYFARHLYGFRACAKNKLKERAELIKIMKTERKYRTLDNTTYNPKSVAPITRPWLANIQYDKRFYVQRPENASVLEYGVECTFWISLVTIEQLLQKYCSTQYIKPFSKLELSDIIMFILAVLITQHNRYKNNKIEKAD